MATPPAAPVPLPVKAGFGVGSLGTGIFNSVPAVLLLYFMTDTLGIAASLAAWAMFIPKIWDVVTDPLMGVISDRTHTRWGRRRPYMFVGAILMSVTFVFLFNVPEFESDRATFFYVMIVFTLSATAYTIFAVPYIAMPTEMSTDPHERTKIMTWRMAFMTLGILLGSGFAPTLIEPMGGGRQGYAAMSWVVGLFCASAMLLSVYGTRHAKFSFRSDHPFRFREQLTAAVANRPFMALLIALIIQLTAVGVITAAAPFYADQILKAGDDTERYVAMLLVSFIGMAIVSMPLWAYLCGRLGKLRAYCVAVVGFSLFCSTTAVASENYPLVLICAQVACVGMCYGGTQVIPYSMLTDTLYLDTLRSGHRREGIFTGVWTAGDKLGVALGGFVMATVLGLVGYVESAGGPVVQPDTAVFGIRLAFSVVPAVTMFASLGALWFYEVDENELIEAPAEV
jgi:glycoside/pentoside/hexuronide:cation symporter, GPH family